MLSYLEMAVVGLLQGVSELFPVSSLGHSVLLPALVGGVWARDLDMGAPGSAYLDALVAMHVSTALALVVFFRRDWAKLVRALVASVRERRIRTLRQRLAWLLVAGTVPVGLAGLALDRVLREYLGRPVPAAVFLVVNGIVLFAVEHLHRRRAPTAAATVPEGPQVSAPVRRRVSATEVTTPMPVVRRAPTGDARLARLGWWEAIVIGACQVAALLPGISRSGVTIAGGLLRGLRHDEAARFAFLSATPVIAAAGLFKLPDLARPQVRGSLGPVLLGSVVAGVGAYLAVRFLVRYFETRTLRPFAVYCVVGGTGALAYLTLS